MLVADDSIVLLGLELDLGSPDEQLDCASRQLSPTRSVMALPKEHSTDREPGGVSHLRESSAPPHNHPSIGGVRLRTGK